MEVSCLDIALYCTWVTVNVKVKTIMNALQLQAWATVMHQKMNFLSSIECNHVEINLTARKL